MSRKAQPGLLMDTNVLLLYVVGTFDVGWIAKHKRTKKYLPAHYEDVKEISKSFVGIKVTPHILSEVSNLIAQSEISEQLLKELKAHVEVIEEYPIPSVDAAQWAKYEEFGLTDSSIYFVAKQNGYTVITEDFDLAGVLRHNGVNVLNLNQLRASDLY